MSDKITNKQILIWKKKAKYKYVYMKINVK